MSSNMQNNHPSQQNRRSNRVSPPGGGGPPGSNNVGTNTSRPHKRKQDEVVENEGDDDSNAIAPIHRTETKDIHAIVSERLWSKEPFVVSMAMESLLDLVADTNINAHYNRNIALTCGAPVTIIKAMKWSKDYGYAVNVWSCGCYSLSYIAKLKDSHQSILGINGLQACLQAMEEHPGSSDVCSSGCHLIGTLLECPYVRKDVIDQGGLTAVMQAMDNHKQQACVQWNGCYAFRILVSFCESPTSIKTAVDAGGIQVVIGAMENLPNDGLLQISGCIFLQILARHHEDYGKSILQAKGLSVVGEAVRIHQDNGTVVYYARAANSAIIGA